MSVHEQENELIFESFLSKRKQLNESTYEDDGYKVREFQTYNAWKSAVKKLNPSAKFTGDKDIDSCNCKECDAEWDGEKGTIQTKVIKEDFDEEYDSDEIGELFNLAKDYYSAKSNFVKTNTKSRIDNLINKLNNSSNEEGFDNFLDIRDQIYEIMQVGSSEQDEYNSERAAERRMEQYGAERGY